MKWKICRLDKNGKKWLLNFLIVGFVLPKKVDPCFKLFAKNQGLETKVDYDTNTFRFLIKNVFLVLRNLKSPMHTSFWGLDDVYL